MIGYTLTAVAFWFGLAGMYVCAHVLAVELGRWNLRRHERAMRYRQSMTRHPAGSALRR